MITRSEPSALTFQTFEFASYLLPLAVLQVYFLAQDNRSAGLRYAAAAALFGSAAYMAIGVFAFAMIFVRAVLGAA